ASLVTIEVNAQRGPPVHSAGVGIKIDRCRSKQTVNVNGPLTESGPEIDVDIYGSAARGCVNAPPAKEAYPAGKTDFSVGGRQDLIRCAHKIKQSRKQVRTNLKDYVSGRPQHPRVEWAKAYLSEFKEMIET